MRLLRVVLALASFSASAQASERLPAQPTGAELAACRTAADQPVCLLKLVARTPRHKPFDAEIAIAYAPDVLAAIGPETFDPMTAKFTEALAAPERAAIRALVQDQAGKSPLEALAAIGEMSPEPMPVPGDPANIRAEAAARRIRVYELLWNAGHGDAALPPARRPSEALDRAVLDAWEADLPLAGKEGDASALADAFRTAGDTRRADRVAPAADATAVERVNMLLASARIDDAVDVLHAMKPTADPITRLDIVMSRMLVMTKAVEAGRTDVALKLAESQLDAWFAEATDPAHPGPAHSGSDIASDLVLVAQFAPRPEAVKWTERMDALARRAPPLPAVVSAWAAMQAWTRLGQPSKTVALQRLWPEPSEAELKACVAKLFWISPQCQRSPGALLALISRTAPLGADWAALSPLAGLMGGRGGDRTWTSVEAELTRAVTGKDRFDVLQKCARAGAEMQPLSLSAECARKLAAAPAPDDPAPLPQGWLSYAQRRLNAALGVAWRAAEDHQLGVMQEMLDLAFALAARAPDEQVDDVMSLKDIAIAELRQQNRL